MTMATRRFHAVDNKFQEIFEFYSKKLYCYALSFVGQGVDAEDIVQDVFIRFWKSENYILLDDSVVKTYLFNSVRNACLNKLEKKDALRSSLDILNYEVIEEELLSFGDGLYDEIRQEIKQMSPQTQKVITAVFVRNMKYQEVADELGVSLNTVKTLLKNGVKRLRERFAKRMNLLLGLVFHLLK